MERLSCKKCQMPTEKKDLFDGECVDCFSQHAMDAVDDCGFDPECIKNPSDVDNYVFDKREPF